MGKLSHRDTTSTEEVRRQARRVRLVARHEQEDHFPTDAELDAAGWNFFEWLLAVADERRD